MSQINSKTIVFITGAFIAHCCWDKWKIFFESKGYITIAPPWPFKNESPEKLRRQHPHNTGLAALTMPQLITYYIDIIGRLPEKPIAIGHSIGGLIAQVICNRDLVAGAVAIQSAPTWGVFPYEFSFLRSGWKAFGLFTSLNKTYLMSFQDWRYAFVNGMSSDAQLEAYENFAMPESKLVIRGSISRVVKVDYKKPHAPLLLLAGTSDNFIPTHLSRRNYKKYLKKGHSITQYKELQGRNHFVLELPTWKEDAEYIFSWIRRLS